MTKAFPFMPESIWHGKSHVAPIDRREPGAVFFKFKLSFCCWGCKKYSSNLYHRTWLCPLWGHALSAHVDLRTHRHRERLLSLGPILCRGPANGPAKQHGSKNLILGFICHGEGECESLWRQGIRNAFISATRPRIKILSTLFTL